MNNNKLNKRHLLDDTFNLEKNYFIKELNSTKWDSIKIFVNEFFSKGKTEETSLINFFAAYPALKKGSANLKALRKLVDDVSAEHKELPSCFDSYKCIMNFIMNDYMMAKPAILESHFFPSEINENKVINMLRTCKISLDIAIFTLTNDKIFAAIEEAWNNNVDVRIITDDECCNQIGSDIFKLAAMGIPIKTDNSKQYHMHHKYAVLDESVVVTGSFNWTTQAVKFNQENILFLENNGIAKLYTENFNKMWNEFKTIIEEDEALKKVQEERKNKRQYYNK